MSETPIAALHTEGRVFGSDWTIANVATLLRSNAARGVWRRNATGLMAKLNQNYLRTVSAQHLPTNVTLMFMRLDPEKCRYASLCFAGPEGYLPWNAPVAEQWIGVLFGGERPEETGSGSVRQYTLANY